MKTIETPFAFLKNPTGKHKDWYGVSYIEIFCNEINPENKFFDKI